VDSGGNAPGARPVNFVFLSGEAQPLTPQPEGRRFFAATPELRAAADAALAAVLATQAGAPRLVATAGGVRAQVLAAPLARWYEASVRIDDDFAWTAGEPLISVEVENDETHRMVFTKRQARALGALLLALVANDQPGAAS